jgi:hypothetical protein
VPERVWEVETAADKNIEDRQSNRSDNDAIFKIRYAVFVAPKAHKCCLHLRQRLLPKSLAQASSALFADRDEHEQRRTASQVYSDARLDC